jgi:toxin ParE1/3/4
VRIAWTRLALADLDSVYDFIAVNNPVAAVATIDRIEYAVQRLLRYPSMGRPGRIGDTRELVVAGTPFIVVYNVTPRRVEILGVIHGARRWPGR